MTTNPIPPLIKEQYYTKVFAGNVAPTTSGFNIPGAKIGYFYLDVTAAKIYAYDGTTWTDVSGAISIAL